MGVAAVTAGIELVKSIIAPAIDHFWPDANEEQRKKIELITLETKAYLDEQRELTLRQQADMASDSWLSKNIRPSVLAFILTAYLVLSVLDGFGFRISEQYIMLLGQWGMVVMSFYFGGRTIEKILSLKWAK